MSLSLKLQLFIAFIMILSVVFYSFINLTSQNIDFINIPREEQIYFVCLIINELIYAFMIIYGIILCFWNTLTSCWREGSNNSSEMSCSTCIGFIFFIFSNLYIFYCLYIERIEIPEYLNENGNIFLGLILALIIEGILFSFIRNCISCEKKKQIRYNNMEDAEEIV